MEVKERKMGNKTLVIFLIIVVLVVTIIIIKGNKAGISKTTVKITMDKIIDKSDLETVNFNYNVIAKKCKNNDNCDMNSNNINDFLYVISCKGTVTAGIDFKDVKINLDKGEKKLLVILPEATIKEVNVGPLKFLNGDELAADVLPNARKLCKETIKQKSKEDDDLIPAAKEQASVVLKSFYDKWLKAFDEDYNVEVK